MTASEFGKFQFKIPTDLRPQTSAQMQAIYIVSTSLHLMNPLCAHQRQPINSDYYFRQGWYSHG